MTDRTRLQTVSELAGKFGLTAQALRFYETRGLLSPKRAGGARVYDYRDHARLTLIQKFRRLGFSLDEIAEYLAHYRSGRPNARQYRDGLAKIERRLADLKRMRRELDDTVAELEDMKRDALARLKAADRSTAN
ncbi:MAG TPA: MerR family transcriptional regulator [Candidatus Sulfotelmatobacter sp.]|nr:MerR family transcriptional regulator [Candidatus Sulfotelmatobacter sp.]